jgi:3-oxoacyl-[acyl-carrier protein] reductase
MPPVPVVLVTGASRGLGRGIAIEAAAAGLSVAINYASNAVAADETVESCRRAAPNPEQRFVPVRGDISQRDDRTARLAQTLDGFGRLNALVNNAGMAPRVRADLTETSEASFEELLRVNLQGPFFLTQAVANHGLTKSYEPVLAGGSQIVS